MDPITLITTALVAGASAGVQDVAAEGVHRLYDALRTLVRRALERQEPPASPIGATAVLEAHEADPETWAAPLAQALRAAGVERDDAILAAATELLRRTDPEGSAAGKYVVDARGAQGVQIGDHGTMRVVINAPPQGQGPGD